MDSTNSEQPSIDEKLARLDAGWDEANARNVELGEGLKVGKVVTFPVADGKAAYEVVEVGEDISYVEYRPELCLDNYHSEAVSNGRIFTDTLERAVRQADFWLNRSA